MTQRISILFGELITDAALHRAVPLPGGVYEGFEPAIAGPGGSEGWTVSLTPGNRGVSVWRTAGLPFLGSHTIFEDGPVTVHIDGPSSKPRIDLVVGAHRWVEGPMDAATGYPTGAFTSDMLALYGVVKGIPDDLPLPPPLPLPFDATGRRATILAQVHVPASGTPSARRWPSTDQRLERRGLALGNATLDEAGWLVEGQIPPVAKPVVVPDLAALPHVLPLQHTALAIVTGSGIYRYDQTSSQAEGATVIKPTAAGGRWIQVLGIGSGATDSLPPTLSGLRIDGNIASATVVDNVGVVRVEFQVDGVIQGSAAAPPWQVTLDLSGLNGSHILTAIAFDAAGNSAASAPLTFTVGGSGSVDTQAPTVSASVTGSSGTLTLSAEASDNIGVVRVEFSVDGNLKGTLYTAPWTLPLDSTTLANGTHALLAKAFDAAGNAGSSPTVSFQVSNGTADSVPPLITNLRASAFTPAQEGKMALAVDLQDTRMGNVDLFHLQNGIRVAIGAMSAGESIPPNYHYALSWAYPADLHGRDVTFVAVATDAAGNQAELLKILAVDDGMGPKVTWEALPTNGNLNPGEAFTFKLRTVDASGISRVLWMQRDDSGGLIQQWSQSVPFIGTSVDGTWELSLTAGAEGEGFFLGAEVVDTQGNRVYASGELRGVLVQVHDTQGPVLSNLRVEDTTTPAAKVIRVDASDLAGMKRVSFFVDGGPVGVAFGAPYQALWSGATPGTHTVRAIAEDVGLNSSSLEIQVTIGNTDLTAPQVTWVAPSNDATVTGPFQAQVSAVDTVGVISVNWYVNGVLSGSQNAPTSGSPTDGIWSMDLDATGLSDGASLAIEAVASDAAGNTGSATATVHKPLADTMPPTVAVAVVSSNLTSRTYRATVSDNVEVVRVEWDVDADAVETTTQIPHEITLDLAGFELGSHTLHAVAFDAAGNNATASRSFFIRDDADPGCFQAGTWVLTPEGPKHIEGLRIGNKVLTIPERAHEDDAPTLVSAEVLVVHHHHGAYVLLNLDGLGATPEHAWGTEDFAWAPTEALATGTRIRAVDASTLTWVKMKETPAAKGMVSEVFNLTVEGAKTFLVAAQPTGPFLLAHNMKIQTL